VKLLVEYVLLVPAAVVLAQTPANPPSGVCSIPLVNGRSTQANDGPFTFRSPKPSADGKELFIVNVKPPAPPCLPALRTTEPAPAAIEPQPASPATAPPAK
jgi:hypothetical protein